MPQVYHIVRSHDLGYIIIGSNQYDALPGWAYNRSRVIATATSEVLAQELYRYLPKEAKNQNVSKVWKKEPETGRMRVIDVTPKKKPVTTSRQQWQKKEFVNYAAGGISAAIAQGAYWEKSRPARAATLHSDVLVPLAQAGACGLSGGLVILGIVLKLEWEAPASWFLLGMAAAFVWSWAKLLGDHRELLWEKEFVEPAIVKKEKPEPKSEPEKEPGPRIYRSSDRKLGSSEDWRYFLDQLQRGRLTARQWTGEEDGWDSARFPSGVDVQDAWRFHCHEMVRLGCATREYQTAPLEVVMRWEKVYHRVFG